MAKILSRKFRKPLRISVEFLRTRLYRIGAWSAVLTAAVVAGQQKAAAQQTWSNTGGDFSWNNAANWNTAVPLATDLVTFSDTGFGTVTLDTAAVALGLSFTNAAGSNYTISNGTGTGLTIGGSGITSSSTGANTIGASLTLGASQAWTIASGGSLTVSGAVAISNALNLNGAGTVTLSGANTGAGGVTLTSGTLNINSAAALGTGTFVIAGGTINNTSAGAVTLSGNNAQSWTGDFTFGGAQALNLGTGAVTMSANRIITVNGTGALTVGGVIAFGANSLTVAGTGAGGLILTGTNTGTAAVTVNSGARLTLGNTVANGALPTGTLTVNGNFVIAPNATNYTIANLIAGNGTITLAGLTTSAPPGVTLSSTTSTFTGNYVLNQGRLIVTAQTNLGSATSPITTNGSSTNGGQFWVNATSITIANPLTLNGYGPLEAAGNLGSIRFGTTTTISGSISLPTNASVAEGSGTLSGLISGPGQLMVGVPAGNRTATATFTGANNTFSGGVLANGATVAANAIGTLGTGAVILGTSANSTLTQSVANAVTGTNSLTVNGGTATLSFANNFTGGLTINGGTLNVNAAGAIGNNNLVQTGGTVAQSAANGFQGPITLNLSGGTTNLSQANAYTGGANISGTNVTNISAAGALSGITNVTGGTLSSSLLTGPANNGQIFISGGLMTTPLAGGQFQNVGLSAAGVVNAGGVGTVGTGPLMIRGLTTSGGTLQFDVLSTTNADLISLTGSYSIGAGTNIGFSNGLPAINGNYKLIQFSGAAPTIGNFTLPSAPSGLTYTLSTGIDAGFVDLVVSGTLNANSANWLPTGATGSWNTAANWSTTIVPRFSGDTANFNSALTVAQAVTVDGQQHVGTLILNPSAAFVYTVNQGTTGSTIFIDNGASAASLQNLAQNNTINAPINLVSANTNALSASGTTLTLAGVISGTGKFTMAASGTGAVSITGAANTFTGGLQLDGGILRVSADGGFGATTNSIVLNGGTLSLNGTTTQVTFNAARTVNFLSASTVDIPTAAGNLTSGANPSSAKFLTSAGNQLTGSGTITKTGNGDFQLTQANPSLTSNWVVNGGILEVQNPYALGSGSATVNANAGITTSGFVIANTITLDGGTLAANGSNNGAFLSTIAINAGGGILSAAQFQATPTTAAQNFAIGGLSGSGAVTVIGPASGANIGMVAIGSNIGGYTGTITVGSNGVLGLPSGANLTGTPTLTVPITGGIGMVADGNGTSTPEVIAYTLPTTAITFTAGNTTGYYVGKIGASAQFNQEANKTISLSANLQNNAAGTLQVTPLNGFGLRLTAQDPLTATQTYNVAGTQASNVVAGLTITNLAGADFGIVKSGTGTLQLGLNAADTSNTFGFAAATPTAIDITAGTLSAFSDANLGAAGNGVRLNNATSAQFLALNTFSTGRTITLNAATGNQIGVAGGQTLTITSGLAYAAVANTLTKVDNGTLVLTAAATGVPTSGTTISAGALQISNSNQIGTGTVTNAAVGASLQLNNVTGNVTQAVALNSVGISSSQGGIHNLAGANTISGVITINGGSLITNADTANTFTLGAITNTTTGFNAGTPGVASNITIGGIVSGGGVVNATGGTVRLTAANTTTGAFNAYSTMILSGAAGANGAGTANANLGGTLTLDNSGTNLNNRTTTAGNQTAFHTFATVGGGNLNLIGNAGVTSTENLLGINMGRGQTVFTVTPSVSQPANLILTAATGAFTRAAFSTATFASSGVGLSSSVGTAGTASASINTGPITTAASFVGAGTAQTGTANIGILPWATVNNNGTITFATSSVIGASGFLRNLAVGETFNGFSNYLNASSGSASNTLSTVALTTALTTNNNIASSLFVGQGVSGTGIPAGAFITAISGTSITLSAAGTTAGTNVPITFGTTGVNIGLTAPSTGLGGTLGQAGTLAQTINSLTLNTGATLSQPNSNTVLTIANNALGGAVLSLDSAATITGGQITGGTNELIFQTPSNLSVGSNIVGGAGGAGAGVTKGGTGNLTLTGNSFHNGQTIINGGTFSLAAGNNTIQYANFTAPQGGSTVQLNGNSQIVTDLFTDTASLSGLGTLGGSSTITGSAGAAMVLRRDASARTYAGTLGGSIGLLVSGANATWTLTQNNTYSGPTYIAGGVVQLLNGGSLSGTSSLIINGGTLSLDNTGSIDSSNRLPASLAISIANGGVTYVGRTQFASAQTLGNFTVPQGVGTISVTQQTTGVSSATLTIGGVSRSLGASVNFANTNGTLGAIGSNPQILYSVAPTLTNNLIGGGFTVNGTDFASYNPTFGVGALGTTGFAGYSPLPISIASATDNVTMASNNGVSLNNQTINSLRVTGTTAINLNAGQTLTLASGGLLASGNLTLGGAVNQGNLTSGGPELFLLGGGTSTINSVISGSLAVVRSAGTYTLAGTNTYTGGTYALGGTTTLANAGNVTTGQSTLGTGGIFISSGTFNQTAGGVIPSQALTILGSTNSGSSTVNLTSNLAVANSVTSLNSNVITVPSTNGIAVGQLVTGTGIPGNITVAAVNPANNTVTVSSGVGVAAGTNTLTFLVNNTLSNLTFNNTGGINNPTLNVTGILNLPNGSITASSTNPASTSTLAGGTLDFANSASPTITVNPIAFNGQNVAPLQPTLNITSAIQRSSSAINITGGGNLQLGGASTFSGGVNLAGNAAPSLATNLTIAAGSTNAGNGAPLSGPLGIGTLTIGFNSTLLHDGTSRTVGNNVVVSGNFGFDAPSTTAATLTLGANSSTIALPAAVATTITVNAPQMTGALGGSVTGAGSSIVKAGLGTLQLGNGVGGLSTFSGGLTLNAGTLIATGVGATGTALGSGTVTVNGGLLALRHSGQTSGSFINYGNNVTLNGTLANAYIDVNNAGANTGNTIVLGTLGYTGFTAGNPAPSTILNITGGNSYKLQFTGTTLTGATTSPTFNVGSGLSLILPGGFTIGTNLPTNIGAGTLVYSGSNSGSASSPIAGTVLVAPFINQNNTPLGTGGLTLNAGSTLQISPLYSNALNATGYTSGGMTAKYYNTGATTMAAAANYGIAPNSALTGVLPNDSLFRQAPNIVNSAGLANTLAVYQGLLSITAGGTYYFGGGSDDQLQISVDGQLVQSDIGAGHGLNQQALQSITLGAGTHSLVVRAFNNGGGGSVNLFYTGPDTAGNGITGTPPISNLQAIPLSALSFTNSFTAGNNFQKAAVLNNPITIAAAGVATIDGLGTDFNYAVPNLTLGSGSTLSAVNGTGAAGFIGNGAFIVTGTTDVTAGPGTLNPTTATLVLSGGVNDGGQGLTKTGAGNLILGASSSFSGSFSINGGFVQLADPAALTTGTTNIGVAATTPATLDLNGQAVTTVGNIILNGGAGPAGRSSNTGAGLYNSSAAVASLPAGSTLTLGAAIATVNPSIGGFGDIIINGTVQDGLGTAFNKVGPNFLTLNGANTFSGALNVNGGRVIIGNTSALGGTGGATVVAGGAALDLNGFAIGTEPLTLSGTGQTGVAAANTLGALINSSAAASSVDGAITLSAAANVGGPRLTAGNGGITLNGAFTGGFSLAKVGANSLTLTATANPVTFFDVQAGSFTLSGNGAQTSTNNANLVRQGATYVLDNTAVAVSNRMGNHGLWFSGSFNIIGNASTAVSEIISQGGNNFALGTTFGNGFGGATMTLSAAGTAGVTVQVASTSTSIFARAVGTSALLRGDNLGGAPGAGVANILGNATSLGNAQANGQSVGQQGAWGTSNTFVYPWAVVDTSATGVGTAFAAYNGTTNGVSPLTGTASNFIAAAPTILTLGANTTNASTTVVMQNTTGLVAGQLVTGTGIAAGTTIATVNPGVSIILSANATATANNTLSFYTIGATPVGNIANLVSTNATNPVGSASAAQVLNSITLNNASGASLAITGGLQVDSGGILAVGTDGPANSTVYTISGAMLAGTNNLNREMIFHTTGTGTTLNVTAPLFANGGGLTKADGGRLVLGSAGIYTGDTSITGGTLQLAGGVNTIFKPFTTAPTSGNNQNNANGGSFSGQNFTLNFGGTLDLNGNTQAIANLRSGGTVPLSGGTIINSNGSAATLNIALSGGQTWAGNISNSGAGVLNLVRDGNNTLTVNSPNTFGGTFTAVGGATLLVDLGTFENASAITVTRSALIWDNTGIQAVSNRLSSTAPITLNGGGFQFRSRAASGATPNDAISLGTLNLGLGASSIVPATVNQGGASQITFAGIGTRNTGATLNFGNATFAIGDNPRVFFTAAPALTNGIIGGWATAIGLVTSTGGANAGFATYDPAGGVRVLQYQPNATYGTGVNTMLTASATLPGILNTPTTTTINSLSLYNATLSFTNATDTLIVQSGGILNGTAASGNIGSTGVPGIIQSGAGNDLYLQNSSNTLTVNSKIIDNGSNNNLVISNLATGNTTAVTLTNANTYGGTTYVSGAALTLNSALGVAVPGNIILSGTNNAATDSLNSSLSAVNWNLSNQVAATASITVVGGAQLNVGNGTNGLVSNTQTINNLTFNNDGGTNSTVPNVFTGAGGLTINGTLASTNITAVTSIPTMSGFLTLSTGNINVEANQFVQNQLGLAINANISTGSAAINKTGAGWLGIGGQSANYLGNINVNAGGLAVSANSGSSGAIVGGQVILAAGTTLDPRGFTGTFGSVASSAISAVIMNGLQGTAGTVITGLDNTNASFAGTISSPYPTGLLSVTKIGTGSWTLTNNSTSTNNGTLTVNAGSILLNSATAAVSFTTTTVNTGGTITLDNSVNALNNRLGGSTLSTTAAVLAPTYRSINLTGGTLAVLGNTGSIVNESLGNITGLSGGILTLNAAGSAGVNVTIGQIAGQSGATGLLIRGTGLGGAAGANVATVQFTTAGAVGTTPGLTFPGTQGGGANDTTTRTIRADILVDSSATGTGTSFLTVDSLTGLIRPLTSATELAPTLTPTTTATTNVGLSSAATGTANVTFNSLTLSSGGGVNLNVIANNAWGPNGGMLTISPANATGLLAFPGNTGVTAGSYTGNGDVFQVTSGSFTMNATLNTTAGFSKGGAGAMILNQPYADSGTGTSTVTINGGTLQLGSGLGANPIFVKVNVTAPTATGLALNNGTFDLNGNSQLVGAVTTTNPLPFAGGTVGSPNSVVTNSSATPATFTTNAAATVVGTVFSGNLSFEKAGTGTMTLTSPQTYTGTTTVRGGNLTLRDSASIASSGTITANYAVFGIDNQGLSNSTTRINAAATINLTGGSFRYLASGRVETTSLATVNLNSGMNEFNINGLSSNAQGSSITVNIGNLTQAANSTLNFVAANATYGNFQGANPHVYLTQLNGVPFNAASMVNGIIAPWMTANQNDWATYSNVAGITTPGNNGTAGYSGNALGAGVTTDNISVGATVQSVTARTINTLAVRNPGAATTIGLNGPLDRLVIASGGVILNNNAQAVAIQGGTITAGSLNTPSTLYLNSFNGTTTINTPIVNNGATFQASSGNFTGGTGALTLIRNGGGTVTVTPQTVESVPFAASAPASTSLTVPSSTGLFVGMGVSGGLITTGTTITAIAGNVLTLSAATTANGATAVTNQITFAPPTSAATSGTTIGSPTVTTAANAFATGFTPTVGMAVGGPNIPGGATLLSFTGTNAAGFSFTLSQNALATSATNAVTVGALSNTYTGPTIVGSGSLTTTGGALNLTGLPGTIAIPGDLTINNSTVTMVTNQGQIAGGSNITLNGGSTLTLVGTNRLNNTLRFNNAGGGATPTVAAGTLLDIAATTAVNAINDNPAFTPTISGTTLNLSSATGTTITTSGLSPIDLIISAQLTTNALNTTTTTGQTITKAGTGSLVLPNANAAVLLWNLNAGSLILNNATALGAAGSTLAVSGNSAILAGTAALTVATPVTFTTASNLTLGSSSTVNQITLSGAMNLGGFAQTFTVPAQPTTSTISGVIGNGALGITKAGAGALTLSGANSFTGPVNVTGGLLTMGNAGALGGAVNASADLTVATGAAFNLNANGLSVGSLAGGGLVTNSGAAQILTVGSGSNATFSGTLTAATPVNLALTKIGSNTQTLSGTNFYTGGTTINLGILAVNGTIGSGTGTNVTVNGGTLQGTGTVIHQAAGSVTVNNGGSIKGGITNTPGTLSIGNATIPGVANINTGANLILDLRSAGSPFTATGTLTGNSGGSSPVAGTDNSRVALAGPGSSFNFNSWTTGSINIVGNASLFDGTTTNTYSFLVGSASSAPGFTDIVENSSALSRFNISNFVGAASIQQGGTFSLVQTNGNIYFEIAPVPEPSEMLLIGSAMAGLVGWFRRRRNLAKA